MWNQKIDHFWSHPVLNLEAQAVYVIFNHSFKQRDTESVLGFNRVIVTLWSELFVISYHDQMFTPRSQTCHNVSLQDFGRFFDYHDSWLDVLHDRSSFLQHHVVVMPTIVALLRIAESLLRVEISSSIAFSIFIFRRSGHLRITQILLSKHLVSPVVV